MAKIFFIGSIPHHQPGTNQPINPEHIPMFDAAYQLGYALAKRGHTLIIGSESERTIDYHVAQGVIAYCNENPNQQIHMEIHRPTGDKRPYSEKPSNLSIRHESYYQGSDNKHTWIVTHIRMLDICDAVITIGGGNSTALVGNIAIRRRTPPLIPVASFGGASEELFTQVELSYTDKLPNDADSLDTLRSDWHPSFAESIIQLCEKLAQTYDESQPTKRHKPHTYFISYSWDDVEVADHIEVHLTRYGEKLLRDEGELRQGDLLKGAIQALIEQADTFIVLWSKNYRSSNWCHYELDYARQQNQVGKKPRRIVFFKLDETDLLPEFEDTLYSQANERDERQHALMKLIMENRK